MIEIVHSPVVCPDRRGIRPVTDEEVLRCGSLSGSGSGCGFARHRESASGGPPTTNLEAYFEADQVVTSGGGTLLDTWTDLSGNGHDAVDTLSGVDKASVKTFGGYPVVEGGFSAGTTYLFGSGGITQPGRTAGGAQAQTVYMVCAWDTSRPNQTIMPVFSGPTRKIRFLNFGGHVTEIDGLAGTRTIIPDNTLIVVRYRYSPTVNELHVPGVGTKTDANTLPTADETYTHLAAGAFCIQICGIYFYDEDAVVSAQDTAIQAYLTGKWGV